MRAAQAIQAFTHGMDASAYTADEMVQAAVERKFEIIGEALNQLAKMDGPFAARIPDVPQIVAFRNQLIHGYASVRLEYRAIRAAGFARLSTAATGRTGE